MPSIESLSRAFVYEPREAKKAAKANGTPAKPRRLGRVHNLVFSPDGRTMVGILVKRPDVAGMVKREDLFVAWDRIGTFEGGLITRNGAADAYDDKARARLGLDWERCIIWEDMDVATRSGKVLGRVADLSFDADTGTVEQIFVTDGNLAASIVGSLPLTSDHVLGVVNQTMVVTDEVEELELTGGLAAKAGEGFAKARVKGSEVASKAGAAAGELIDKGSFALGKAIGTAKNVIQDAMKPDEAPAPAPQPAEVVAVEGPNAPAEVTGAQGEPPIFSVVDEASEGAEAPAGAAASTAAEQPSQAPAAEPASNAPAADEPTIIDDAAKFIGAQIGKTKTMFSEFLKEFNEANR